MSLPPLPPRPSDTPPPQDPNGSLTRAWESAWRVYWLAVNAHQSASLSASVSAGADTMTRKTEDDVILACAVVMPKHDGERDATWAKRAADRGRALYAEMQK